MKTGTARSLDASTRVESEFFGHSFPESTQGYRWHACYTRAHHEKRVDALLRQRGFECFLPLYDRQRQWHDRRKVVPWPLFPSYTFVRSTPESLYLVLGTPGVATIVATRGRPVPISDEDIDNVRRFTAALNETGLEPVLRPYVHEGQRVRIMSGPFEAVEGLVIECRSRGRVLVGVRSIGHGLEIDIDTSLLQVMPEPA